MAVNYAGNMSILVGGYEAAAVAKSSSFMCTCTELDTSNLANTDGWSTFICGPSNGTIQLDGTMDFADGQIDSQIMGANGKFRVTGTPQSFLPAGIVDGSLAYFAKTVVSTFTSQAKWGELVPFSMTSKISSGPLVRGLLLHPTATARTTSASGTGRTLGAVSAQQKVWTQLHVTGGTAGTLIVKLQSADVADTGFASATDRITFTTVTGALTTLGASEAKSLVGAITDTLWRVVWTIAGGGTWHFAVTAGIAAP